jgi:hypothetical protein
MDAHVELARLGAAVEAIDKRIADQDRVRSQQHQENLEHLRSIDVDIKGVEFDVKEIRRQTLKTNGRVDRLEEQTRTLFRLHDVRAPAPLATPVPESAAESEEVRLRKRIFFWLGLVGAGVGGTYWVLTSLLGFHR